MVRERNPLGTQRNTLRTLGLIRESFVIAKEYLCGHRVHDKAARLAHAKVGTPVDVTVPIGVMTT